jgi:phosphatidate cytidylyltransferase
MPQRILVGSIFGFLALSLLLLSQPVFFLFIASLIVLTIYEYAAVCTKKKISPLFFALLIFLLLRGYNFYRDASGGLSESSAWILEQFALAVIFLAVSFPFRKEKYKQIFLFFLGCLWLVMPLFFLLIIFQFPNPVQLFLFLAIITIVNDSFAYFAGKKWGKTKIAPNISPNKTYFGSITGLVCSLLAAFILQWSWQLFDYPSALIIALGISIIGQIGDLIASKLKRILQTKDYGKILLGHGGMLDRLDSVLFAIPVYYFFLYYLS